MLIVHLILAAIAVAALAIRTKRPGATLVVVVACAIADIVLGAPTSSALSLIAPLLAFLGAALTLAALVERSGLAERVACGLAAGARGNSLVLYVLACAVCGLLTATVSLDGAVVLIIPLLLVLTRRFGAPFAPLFLGSVVVANAASIAVPQGNPTNLVIIDRLGLSPATFVAHMLVPGLAAALICATGVAICERRALAAPLRTATRRRVPLSAAEWHAAGSLVVAALTAWAAPLFGIAPWWPFTAAVAVALATSRARPRLVLPWRLALQVGGLVIVIGALGLTAWVPGALGLPALIAVAAGIGAASALANNLPVSVCATGLLSAGAPAYAATIGLAIGSLATPQGSVATLIATQLAGSSAPPVRMRRLAPLAVAATLAATLLLWATLGAMR
jgi:Na+/H+ antiporter NhaD/arsenite permease-like protein